MPRNGSGTFSLAQPPFTPGTTISSASVNSDLSDIATAITASIAADGQTTITGQLKFPSGTAGAPSHTFAADLTTGMYYPGTKLLGFSAGGVAAFSFDLNQAGAGQDGSIFRYGNGAIPTPVGVKSDFAGSTAPAGWFLCYGQAVARASYPELFTVIGTAYGSGDGVTTFNLPDERGRVGAGKDDMGGTPANRLTSTYFGTAATVLGAVGGLESNTLTSDTIAAHTHTGTTNAENATHNHTLPWQVSPSLASISGGAGLQVIITTGTSTTSTESATHAHAFTTNSGGTGNPHANVQPTIVYNKIIFAGRP